jgi:hypothetical protein
LWVDTSAQYYTRDGGLLHWCRWRVVIASRRTVCVAVQLIPDFKDLRGVSATDLMYVKEVHTLHTCARAPDIDIHMYSSIWRKMIFFGL